MVKNIERYKDYILVTKEKVDSSGGIKIIIIETTKWYDKSAYNVWLAENLLGP